MRAATRAENNTCLPDLQLDRTGRLALHRARGPELPSIGFAHSAPSSAATVVVAGDRSDAGGGDVMRIERYASAPSATSW